MKSENPKAHEEQLEAIAKRRKNVPGLDELRQARIIARKEEEYYDSEFDRAIDRGDPIVPSKFIRPFRDMFFDLTKKYPRAAAYLRAMEYFNSSDFSTHRAGSVAVRLIVNGGELREARRILKTCLTENGGEPLKTNPI